MPKIRASILAAVIAGVSPASAYMGIGAGEASCGTWNEDRAARPYMWQQDEEWALGYLTGVAGASGVDLLASTDANGVISWMNGYCAAYPLDRIYQGADKLGDELAHRTSGRP
jgi:hypothetical protein